MAPTCRPTAVEPVKLTLSTRGSRTSSSLTSAPAGRMLSTPVRQSGLDRGLGQQVGVQRRLRRRLQHHGVPRGQGGRELHRGHEQRRVPRDDRDHHADRDAQDAQRPAPGAAARAGPGVAVADVGACPQRVHRLGDLAGGQAAARQPLLRAEDIGELVGAGLDGVGECPQDAEALGGRQPGPRAGSNAARAAPTARSASSLVARGTLPTTSSEAGETTSILSLAEAAGCHRPPRKNTSTVLHCYPAFGVGAAMPGRRASGAGAPRAPPAVAVRRGGSGSPRTVRARAARVAAPASGSGCCHAPSWCRPEARPA